MSKSRVVALILFGLLSCPQVVLAQESTIDRAAQAVESGSFDQAIELLTNYFAAGETGTDDEQAFFLRAISYENLGQLAEAKRDIDTAFSLSPDDAGIVAARDRITALRQSGIQNEIDLLNQRLVENPEDPQARLMLAESLYAAGQFAMSAENYQLYLENHAPTIDIAHRYLDALSRDEFNYIKGEQEAASLVDAFPDDPRIVATLGFFQQLQGNNEAALLNYRRALELNPSEPLATAGSRALGQEGIAVKPNEDSSADYFLTIAQDDPRRALSELDTQIGLQPDNTELILTYATIAADHSLAIPTAELYLSVLLAENDYNPSALYHMARVKYSSGQYDEANRYIRRAQSIDDSDLGVSIDQLADRIANERDSQQAGRLEATLQRAREYRREGRFEEAASQYDVFLRQLERWPADIVLEASSALAASDNYLVAIGYLELVEAPRPPEVDIRIAEYLVEMGRVETAKRLASSIADSVANSESFTRLEERIQIAESELEATTENTMVDSTAKVAEVAEDSVAIILPRNEVKASARAEQSSSAPERLDTGFQVNPISGLSVSTDGDTEFALWSRGGSATIYPGQMYFGGGFLRHTIDERGGSFDRLNSLSQYFGVLGIRTLSAEADFRLIVGVSSYESDRSVPFWRATFDHFVAGKISGGVFVERNEASLQLRSALAPRGNLVLNRAGGRIYSARPVNQFKFDLSAFVGAVKREPAPEEDEQSNDVASLDAEAGLETLRNVFLGASYFQLDFKRSDPRYYSPTFFRGYEGWLEYTFTSVASELSARVSIGNSIDGNIEWVPSITVAASTKLGLSTRVGITSLWGVSIAQPQTLRNAKGFETSALDLGIFLRYGIN